MKNFPQNFHADRSLSDNVFFLLTAKERAELNRRRKLNEKKRQKRKQSKQRRRAEAEVLLEETDQAAETKLETDEDNVEIEYVAETAVPTDDPNYAFFAKVFDAFKIGEKEEEKESLGDNELELAAAAKTIKPDSMSKAAVVERILQQEIEDREKEKEAAGLEKLSRKKLRQTMQPSVAELKASCSRPDVVEWHDVTSREAKLLVHLKSLRNTVPVPRHWCFKRKYLAGKRGFERAPFQLPEYIRKTGIQEMREALQEKESEKSLKSKMREKVRPKMGRIDIDYQKLHDAFFKWQSKPTMSILGDIYYEGKEFETQMREKKPGELSDDLRIALGMPVGPNSAKFPPPWLIAQQRYGPPPSYPNIKVAGLNAPIPEGTSFGYHAGGWGKPPVDEYGKPLYGDVFGMEVQAQPNTDDDAAIERKHWGEMDSDSSEAESSEDEGDDEDADEGEEDPSGMTTPADAGFATPSGMGSSIPTTGMETPDSIELRKRKQHDESGVDTPASLYQVLPEKKVDRVAGQMMASTHVYDVNAGSRKNADGVDVSLNPEELDLSDPKQLSRKYEEGLRKQMDTDVNDDQDFSDMVAEHTAKQNRKRARQDDKKTTKDKKHKDFKF